MEYLPQLGELFGGDLLCSGILQAYGVERLRRLHGLHLQNKIRQ